MQIRMIRAAAALAAAALLLCVPARAASVSAQRAILTDADTGAVLYEKNADERALIASTTKIMTALLACECLRPEDTFVVPAEAAGIEGSSLYLRSGERVSVRDLLLGTMLASGNDAAAALAVCCAGSIGAFVEKMNERAASLGLCDTRFANPHGLDSEENYSTARDLARLTAAALENPAFRELAATKEATAAGRPIRNHNRLLWSCEGCIGVKTGYTKAAGRILVSAAERQGRRLICVTIGAPDDWNDHAALYDEGFAAYEEAPLIAPGQRLGALPVIGGRAASVPLEAAEGFSFALAEGEKTEITLRVPRFIYAPVTAGEFAGNAVILLGGRELGTVPLRFGAEIAQAEPEKRLIDRLIGESNWKNDCKS